ncbi:hypothetical protein C9439_04280 [archaeon SCG-AAA382B04]|nr:hypothetical protein C9439_04280 [archaeon SCG-AAA382B04]
MGELEELKKVISTPFERKGKDKMGRRAFVFALALDLNWFSLEEAKKVLEVSKKKDLLSEEGEKVFPNFSMENVDVSLSFQPNGDFLGKIKKQKDSIMSQIIERIQKEEDLTKKNIISRANEIQSQMEKMIDTEIALMIFAKDLGVKVDDLVNEKISQI